MSRSFFGVLKNLEASSADGVLPNEADSLLRRLIGFVEGGSFTKSETEKFILENFRLSSGEMTRKWNDTRFGRKKEDSTFRGQVSVLSHYLCSLFSVTPGELSDAFYNNESGVLRGIADLLDAFDIGDIDISERFSAIVQGGFLSTYTTDSSYEAEECSKEIQLLKSLDCSVIQEMLSDVDMDKLIYVLQTIREPLVTDIQVEIEGKKKKVKTALVNHGKLEFCRAFGIVKARQPKPVSNIEVSVNDSGVLPNRTEPEVDANPYNLQFDSSLAEVLTQRAEAKMTSEETAKWSKMTEEQRNNEKMKLVRLLLAFTEGGFKRLLRRYDPLIVQEVLDGDYPVEDGKEVYQFRK